jgi:glycogen operon protein
MMLGGDEFGRTQRGNNNAYCQDNEISWPDWSDNEQRRSLIHFVKRLTRLRQRYAGLRQSRFVTGQWNEFLELKDATWFTPAGAEMAEANWKDTNARCFGLLLDGRAPTSGIRKRGSEATLLLIFNAHHDVVDFQLPKVKGGRDWTRLIDTNVPDEDDETDDPVRFRVGQRYAVTGRSLLLFVLRPARQHPAG